LISNFKKDFIDDHSPVIRTPVLHPAPFILVTKRGIDISVALALLVFFSPVMIFLWVLVLIDSSGSPIYKQKRRGYKGKTFLIYKFRTIKRNHKSIQEALVSTDDMQRTGYKLGEDYQITQIGKLLRKYSLDELPQLLNVIRGDMSLVGPRPFSQRVFSQLSGVYSDFDQWVSERHQLPPGMTGLWQVSGRSDVNPEEMMRLDLEYVRNWTISRDIFILLRTLPAVITAKGAY